jgi:hypothetical protein
MKRIFTSMIAIAAMIGCSTEADVDFVKENTFVRYYGTQQNDVAVLALEDLNGGFTLLSTSEIETGVTGQINYNIHLTRLDEWGNLLWHDTYLRNFKTTASSFIQTPEGYFVIGDRIKSDATTDLQILHISDEDGSLIDEKTISLGSGSLHGKAITQDGTDFILLGSIVESGSTNDMYVAKVAGNDLGVTIWDRRHGDAPSELINRIYLQNNENLWGSSVDNLTSFDFRLVRAQEDSQLPFNSSFLGQANYNEHANDFCQALDGWVFTGYTNAKSYKDRFDVDVQINPLGTDDIFIQKINDDATERFYIQLEGQSAEGDDTRNERGNAICMTSDGDYVVLGTAETINRKEDLVLTKINRSGAETWDRRYFGGNDKQEGASVRETSDGSILVFGTTYFGTEKKLILLKLDKNGNL